MAMPGELLGMDGDHQCEDCKVVMKLKVLSTPAGYYLGYECNCGPYSRETHYMPSKEVAQEALKRHLQDDAPEGLARDTAFHG